MNSLLTELATRLRQDGVETVLVNGTGRPWTSDGFGGSFNRVRDIADVVHIDDVSGKRTKKHLHDVRGTFCTKLIIDGKLTDSEAAEVMGWAPDRVSMIRRIYVDQSRVVQAMGAKLHAIK